MSSEEKADTSDPARTLFSTPEGRKDEGKSVLLSPLPTTIPPFARHVVGVLQRVIENNDSAIEFGVSEFLRQFRITNEEGLSLLTEDDVPTGPPDSIWSTPLFRKAFLTVCMGCDCPAQVGQAPCQSHPRHK